MSDDEDDYLSDKFLTESAPKSTVKTYRDLRKEAHKKSQVKNEQNKTKSQRESRQEAMSRSLFEVEKEKQEAGISNGNKALAMMLKMGFKPGESLGKRDEEGVEPSTSVSAPEVDAGSSGEGKGHRIEPVAIVEWSGKKGIGSGGTKRALSPDTTERVAKMVKMADESEKLDFRERSRMEYAAKRAEGQLGPAQRTCATLDEKAGKEFNVLWLNSNNHQTFPDGLIDALTEHTSFTMPVPSSSRASIEGRLKHQMQQDALKPLDDEDVSLNKSSIQDWPTEILEEAAQFLRLQAPDRLELVLSYLRSRYHYCFWCGSQYDNPEDLQAQCPGPGEEDHD